MSPTDDAADEVPAAADADVDDLLADGGDPATDGGTVSQFETVSDVSLSREERMRRALDERVLAPARIIWDDWRARIAVVIIAGYLFMGTVGVLLVPEPAPNQGPRLVGAFRSLAHPLGTTDLGTDILSLTVYATPQMLKMIAAGAVFATAVAIVVGTVSGYKGGVIDSVLMTITDVMMTIPGLPLVIVLAGVLSLQGDPYVIGLLLTINAWAGLARQLRAQVLTLRDAEYVEASRVMGISTPEIILKDIIPNLMPFITMNFVQTARGVIFGSVGLYYIGVLPFNASNWGVMMNQASSRAGAVSSPAAFHWLLIPMMAIIILGLGLTLFAQAADRLFNPRVRARHAKTIEGGDDEEEGGAGGGDAAATAAGGGI